MYMRSSSSSGLSSLSEQEGIVSAGMLASTDKSHRNASYISHDVI